VNSRSPAVLALSGRGYAVFRSVVNFRFTEFYEVRIYRVLATSAGRIHREFIAVH
jgi:hypothetical protein